MIPATPFLIPGHQPDPLVKRRTGGPHPHWQVWTPAGWVDQTPPDRAPRPTQTPREPAEWYQQRVRAQLERVT